MIASRIFWAFLIITFRGGSRSLASAGLNSQTSVLKHNNFNYLLSVCPNATRPYSSVYRYFEFSVNFQWFVLVVEKSQPHEWMYFNINVLHALDLRHMKESENRRTFLNTGINGAMVAPCCSSWCSIVQISLSTATAAPAVFSAAPVTIARRSHAPPRRDGRARHRLEEAGGPGRNPRPANIDLRRFGRHLA